MHQTRTWELRVPDGWEVKGSNELVTLFKPGGVGMLRVLTAEQQAPTPEPTGEVFRGRLPGSVRTSADTSTFRRIWSLTCRGQRLFVTYQSASNNAELELAEVDEIMQSISETGHEQP
jgi:hypothetical protein